MVFKKLRVKIVRLDFVFDNSTGKVDGKMINFFLKKRYRVLNKKISALMNCPYILNGPLFSIPYIFIFQVKNENDWSKKWDQNFFNIIYACIWKCFDCKKYRRSDYICSVTVSATKKDKQMLFVFLKQTQITVFRLWINLICGGFISYIIRFLLFLFLFHAYFSNCHFIYGRF